MKSMPLSEARVHLGELVNQARHGDEPTVLTDHGKEAAVIISMRQGDYLSDLYEREAHNRLAATRQRRSAGWRGIPAQDLPTDDAG
jgi:prevent-host-death family protein